MSTLSVTKSVGDRNVYILALTLVVVTLGVGMIIPILPFYMERLGAGGMELGLLTASYALMRLIFGPFWGSFSDRVGRKPVLLIGIFGYAVTMFWFGLATQLWMMFAARILSGILSAATSPTIMAYIGDCMPEDERSSGMGKLGAAMGLGTIGGPAVGGLLAEFSLSTPFFFAGGLALLSMVLIALFVPESLPASQRQSVRDGKGVDLHSWWQAVVGPLGPVLLVTLIATTGLMIFSGIFGFYALARYQADPQVVGWILMSMGLVSALAQGLLAGRLSKRFGEGALVIATLFATSLIFGLMVLAETLPLAFFTIALFGLFSALQFPALSALASRRADVPQGMAMGLSNAALSLGRIFGPLAGGVLFDVNINLPYLVGAGIMLGGALTGLVLLKFDDIPAPHTNTA